MGSSIGTGPSESTRRDKSKVSDVFSLKRGRYPRLTEDIVEQVAVVLVRVEPVIDVDVGSKSGVQVSEVELAVEGEEDLVCSRKPAVSTIPSNIL